MEADVHKLVDNCIVCLKAKHPTTRFGKLPPKSVEVRPWFEIAVDSIDPYGKKRVSALTIIDIATRLIEILPTLYCNEYGGGVPDGPGSARTARSASAR
ncbi:hypothetical protein PF005_g15379 [Phytophthora fragariae]|nr:hypothetical protein PF003_g3938 [Phytophthora fragariae]KAE9018844.1 hypothetical protein PF011_g6088 [Phytophthora fragariae]KAE9079615.1 hypothetical protein PF007_g23375 [Phytophthora fragariae]KAE9100286.1 hypothetical protein PF010_g14871 [Phytophthora fragariae]KAE9101700.1 hypothetical protein PF006_g22610 [Phytophthora fragariae]